MGFYVNPPNESKESFLVREGVPLSGSISWGEIPKGFLPVVLMDNGPFKAAGIAFSEDELKVFTDPSDRRPKKFFAVKSEKLLSVSDPGFRSFAERNGLI